MKNKPNCLTQATRLFLLIEETSSFPLLRPGDFGVIRDFISCCVQKRNFRNRNLCLANPPKSPFRKGGLWLAEILTPLL